MTKKAIGPPKVQLDLTPEEARELKLWLSERLAAKAKHEADAARAKREAEKVRKEAIAKAVREAEEKLKLDAVRTKIWKEAT